MRFLSSFCRASALSVVLLSALTAPRPVFSLPAVEPYAAARETTRLFREELQQCDAKLNWRGERLADDTIYAAALTGLSWQAAWSKDHVFSLA